MKAIVVAEPGKVVCREVEKPVPGPKEVVARVCYSGICGTDVELYKGSPSLTVDSVVKYPVRIGHEWSGIIESVGSEVTDLKPGDRVISDTDYTCGTCEECRSGNYRKCRHLRSLGTVGNFKDGAHAEYLVNHHWHMHKIPDSFSLEEAILVEPASIAYNAILDMDPKPGKTMLIVGTGAIGLLAVYLAKQKGLRVYLAGRKPSKLQVGLQMGADAVCNLTTDSLEEFVKKVTDGKLIDYYYETTGASALLEQGVNLTANRGTIATLAFYNDHLKDFNVNNMVLEHKRLLGCEGAYWCTEEVLKILSDSKISFLPLITHRVSLEDAPDAIMNSKKDAETKIKVMIEIHPEEKA